MATLEAIQARMRKLQTQADALIAKKAQAALDQIRALMIEHGLTTADIEAKAKARRESARAALAPANAKGKSSPKFQDPKTGATWSGHGRAPAWIATARDRTKFLIAGVAVTGGKEVASKSKAAAKSTGKSVAKGKLPAKYLNPKTGETWSGHARPPAWIKDVKDRSKFLIAGNADGVAASSGAVAKKAASKKIVARKVAAKPAVATKKMPAKKAATTKKGTTSKEAAAKKSALKKASGRKAVAAKKVVAKPDVAAVPESSAVEASA
ncbi:MULTISPECIES: H-NS histone family protein [Paraburkholderia]|uniref:H-NS histone family protein n=1 Tax=Paraburkholderia podalyriae TaxID=1938811 RepID=A0ABR7PG45_9BURK|nr:H-NS histone family protein [Paraburkholderia podalyriae]MBC8745347.1 H-NS histone family protein [Paraburkholderia podalyriae]